MDYKTYEEIALGMQKNKQFDSAKQIWGIMISSAKKDDNFEDYSKLSAWKENQKICTTLVQN